MLLMGTLMVVQQLTRGITKKCSLRYQSLTLPSNISKFHKNPMNIHREKGT